MNKLHFTGSQRGISSWFVRGHQLVRNPRQACHDYAKGHTTGKTNPRRESLECSLPVASLVSTNIIKNHPLFTRTYMYNILSCKTTLRNPSYVETRKNAHE